MSQNIVDLVHIPRHLALRAMRTASAANQPLSEFFNTAVGAYISDPRCAELPMAPTGDRDFETTIDIPRDVLARASGLHPTGTGFDEILTRAVAAHFDLIDDETPTVEMNIILPQADGDALATFARLHQVTVQDIVRRAISHTVYAPTAPDLPPATNPAAPIFNAICPIGPDLARQLGDVATATGQSVHAVASAAVLRYLGDEYDGFTATPAVAVPAKPPAAIITPASRAAGRRLRL